MNGRDNSRKAERPEREWDDMQGKTMETAINIDVTPAPKRITAGIAGMHKQENPNSGHSKLTAGGVGRAQRMLALPPGWEAV